MLVANAGRCLQKRVLGNGIGNIAPTTQEYRDLRDYTTAAEDYGIEVAVYSIQCLSLLDAMVQAAEEIDACIVFAHLPESAIPYWRKFQHWTLERRLMNQHCQRYTLDKPAATTDWVPSISVTQGTSAKS